MAAQSVGNSASPTFYSSTTTATTADMIVTDFPSWLGHANPGTTFGPAYANELGNRLTYGLYINGNGSTFSLSQLNFDVESTDPENAISFSGNFVGFTYDASSQNTIVGRDFSSGNLVLDPTADEVLTELWYVGVGVAFEVDSTDPGATLQDKINATLTDPDISSPFQINATYFLSETTSTSTATVTVEPAGPFAEVTIPEPTSLFLWSAGAALAGVVVRTRRRPHPSAAS